MKLLLKKINILLFIFVISLTSNVSAQVTLNQLEGKEQDFDNTYTYFLKGPELVCDGELIVLGDSFGFLFCEYANKGLNYVVHQGYDISKIYREFLPLVQKNRYKYAFLMIGPNDFMQQTDLKAFKSVLQFIVADLKQKGVEQVIITDYCDPDYGSDMSSILYYLPNKCWQYDQALKDVMRYNGLLYVEMTDLLIKYGRLPLDSVHPAKELYNPLLERVEELIETDKNIRKLNLP